MNRNLSRSQRRRYLAENDIDIQFDWNRPLDQSCAEILRHITKKDVPKNQILAYLNLFIKYCLYRYGKLESTTTVDDGNQKNIDRPKPPKSPFNDKDILCCLRIPLFHEGPEVRSGTLRAIRYLVQSKSTLMELLSLNMHHLIARSLDLVLENRNERLQAIRLIRHILAIEHNLFPLALGRCLCALSNDNLMEKDMLLRVCWATIAELTIVNAVASARSGCINVLVRCALNSITGLQSLSEFDDSHGKYRNNGICLQQMTNVTVPGSNISIAEAILSSFLHLFNYPETRRLLMPNGYDLFYFVSPFTDLYSFYHASKAVRDKKKLNEFNLADHHRPDNLKDQQKQLFHGNRLANKIEPPLQQQQPHYNPQQCANPEQRTLRYLACKNAILSVMRAWPGMFFMCHVETGHTRSFPESTQAENDVWNHENLYLQVDPDPNMRTLRKSLKVFGYTQRVMSRRLAQLMNGIGKALYTDCDSTLTFFPSTGLGKLNPLESLVTILHSPYAEIHRHLLELIYELFGIKPPEWTEDFEVALKSIYFNYPLKMIKTNKFKDSSSSTASSKNSIDGKNFFPDEWELYDDFIANEAEAILPNLSSGRLNFITNYHALLLQSLIDFGLLEALISVILNSHDQKAINHATILTGELLHMSGKYLPPSKYAHRCQSLPVLVAASISVSRERRNRALMIISHLDGIHEIKKHGPQPVSFFLEQQIYFCRNGLTENSENTPPTVKPRSASISKIQDEHVLASIKNSGVQQRKTTEWDWSLIVFILKHPSEMLRKLEEREVRYFIGRLVEFFSPSKRQFSSISKNPGSGTSAQASPSASGRYEVIYCDNPRLICITATYFIDFLLTVDETKGNEFIQPFVEDLERCLSNVACAPSPDDILKPSRFQSTLSRHYFVLLGRFSHFKNGRKWLEKTHIYQYLMQIINQPTNNDTYIKLIVSSLDYAQCGFPRTILARVLTATNESSRLYATKLLRVFLRASVPDFSEWGMDLLVPQLYDQSSVISLEALNILDEACSDPTYLEKVLEHRPSLLNLGDNGIVFFTRLASYIPGLTALLEQNMLQKELDRWKSYYCLRYVRLVEDSLNECFSSHQKGSDGRYGRRSERQHFPFMKESRMISYLPHHLYGQLVKTYQGLQIIVQNSIMDQVVQIIKSQLHRYIPGADGQPIDPDRPTEFDILQMKAALWSAGHLSSSEFGFEYLMKFHDALPTWIVLLVERSTILSIRATGFYAICLMGSTQNGAQVLSQYGWTAVQQSDRDAFPIDDDEFENFHLPHQHHSDSNGYLRARQKSLSPIPLGYFSLFAAAVDELNNTGNNNCSQTPRSQSSDAKQQQNCQLSITSSSSSSSCGYPSIMPISKHSQPSRKVEKTYHQVWNNFVSSDKSQGMSSSTASIFSNASSIGSLAAASSINTTTLSVVSNGINDNRTRSSSDCAAPIDGTNHKTVPDGYEEKMSTKLEYQDSGILDQSGSTKSVSPNRNRKISAPCFQISQPLLNREARSNSNDSTQTNHTASRSTSFTEYSTTSSVAPATGSTIKPETAPTQHSPRTVSLLRQELALMNTAISEDPYPSSVDAYGYARLRAIQKFRVKSLSGNVVRNGIITSSSSSIQQQETDQKNLFRYKFDNCSTNTETTMPDTTPIYSVFLKQRSASVFSGISSRSDDFETDKMVKNKFMCLSLPQTLSLIFHLDETAEISTKRRVTFPNESRKRFMMNATKNVAHISSKCLRCCYSPRANKRIQVDRLLETTLDEEHDGDGDDDDSPDRKESGPSDIGQTNNVENGKPETTVTNNNNNNENIKQQKEQLRKDILRLVSNLGAAMNTKQAEQEYNGLLSLKRKYSGMFEDFCLYSDVCIQMERKSFRSAVRRFLHELFLDVNLSQFYQDVETILDNHNYNNIS